MNFIEMPSAFDDSRTWAAAIGERSYVIFQDEGKFTASYRPVAIAKTIYIIGYDDRVDTFEEAVAACEQAERDA